MRMRNIAGLTELLRDFKHGTALASEVAIEIEDLIYKIAEAVAKDVMNGNS